MLRPCVRGFGLVWAWLFTGRRAVTPMTDASRIRCHDPLSDSCTLSPQAGDHTGQRCGIFWAAGPRWISATRESPQDPVGLSSGSVPAWESPVLIVTLSTQQIRTPGGTTGASPSPGAGAGLGQTLRFCYLARQSLNKTLTAGGADTEAPGTPGRRSALDGPQA